mmetsp:Transcript_5444/g.13931  ORF Transcript_5444/g.13931 Transcript_5444/m.13931 type:complete len:217 (+) Transcript_5444:223-873(+)
MSAPTGSYACPDDTRVRFSTAAGWYQGWFVGVALESLRGSSEPLRLCAVPCLGSVGCTIRWWITSRMWSPTVGCRAITSRMSWMVRRRRSTNEIVSTVALRLRADSTPTTAISPKKWPANSVATRPRSLLLTRTEPCLITYIASPSSPSAKTTSFGAKSRGLIRHRTSTTAASGTSRKKGTLTMSSPWAASSAFACSAGETPSSTFDSLNIRLDCP